MDDKTQARWMKRSSPGWDRMWSQIAAQYGNTVCEHHGEVWQYMGSFSDDDGKTWVHEFRHRRLPPDGRRTYYNVPALETDFDPSTTAVASVS